MAVRPDDYGQAGLCGRFPEFDMGIHVSVAVRVGMDAPAEAVRVQLQDRARGYGGVQDDVHGGVAVSVPGKVIHREQVRMGDRKKVTGFERSRDPLGIADIIQSALGGRDERRFPVIRIKMLSQQQIIQSVPRQEPFVIIPVPGKVLDLKTFPDYYIRCMQFCQAVQGAQMCLQFVIRHAEAEIVIRKRRVIRKAEDGNPCLQRFPDVILFRPLRVPAPFCMRMIIRFHGSPHAFRHLRNFTKYDRLYRFIIAFVSHLSKYFSEIDEIYGLTFTK